MSGEEQIVVTAPQIPSGDVVIEDQPEDRLARLRRVALPSAQRKVGKRQTHGVVSVLVRILAGVGAYCLPIIALCVVVGAIGYSFWVIVDVARSAGSLDLGHVEDAFGQIDVAARAFVASVAYALLVLALYLLAAALRAGETWAPLLVTLIVAAPVALLFTLSADLAFSLAPADALPSWGRETIEALVLSHAILLAILLRARRPVTQALNNLAFTRRYGAGTLYTGALPRLHVIRFATGAPSIASGSPPQLLDASAVEPPGGAVAAMIEDNEPQEATEVSEAPPDVAGQGVLGAQEEPAPR